MHSSSASKHRDRQAWRQTADGQLSGGAGPARQAGEAQSAALPAESRLPWGGWGGCCRPWKPDIAMLPPPLPLLLLPARPAVGALIDYEWQPSQRRREGPSGAGASVQLCSRGA